jgi:hypothetical protein
MQVRKGSMRICFLIGSNAIKLPRVKSLKVFVRGFLSNQDELYKWKTFEGTPKRLLCPIKRSFLGGLIVVFERTRPIPKGTYGKDVFQAIFTDTISLDNKVENFGWLPCKEKVHGKIRRWNLLVVIDYGNPKDILLRGKE